MVGGYGVAVKSRAYWAAVVEPGIERQIAEYSMDELPPNRKRIPIWADESVAKIAKTFAHARLDGPKDRIGADEKPPRGREDLPDRIARYREEQAQEDRVAASIREGAEAAVKKIRTVNEGRYFLATLLGALRFPRSQNSPIIARATKGCVRFASTADVVQYVHTNTWPGHLYEMTPFVKMLMNLRVKTLSTIEPIVGQRMDDGAQFDLIESSTTHVEKALPEWGRTSDWVQYILEFASVRLGRSEFCVRANVKKFRQGYY